jgi:hypothetical protein
MKKVSAFLSLASGVFAVIPGIAVLTSNVGVPPNSSKALFGGVIEAIGVLTLMLLWLNKSRVTKTTIKNINRLSFIAILVFVMSLFTYIFLYNYLVVEVENSDSVFFPLWTKGELKANILKFGSRDELINQWGRDDVYKVIQSSSEIPLLITTLIMLFNYMLTFLSLTFAFGMLAIKSIDKKEALSDASDGKMHGLKP